MADLSPAPLEVSPEVATWMAKIAKALAEIGDGEERLATELEAALGQRNEYLARAEAAEGVVARVRELATAWAEQRTDYYDDTEQQISDGAAILGLLSDPTPGMAPESGDGVNGAPGRQSASPGGTSGANDAGGIRAAVESIKRQAGDWTLDPDGGAGA